MEYIIRYDGFGCTREYPAQGPLEIHYTYVVNNERHIIVQYLATPFCYRKVLQSDIPSLESHLREFLEKEKAWIELGSYDQQYELVR
ncbi:hypothetical protein [Halobacillus naozhouensis]|uniref:Uncharacterized protein n=1 Tax=Halobacillus naozhouensis TaxID=554880 RepID=A0ABY8J5M5_9BACI|nr:hypothetical protein [Halobacillus naozhouensis]WFT76256.1 hypothetical protein P9989_07800 [Halobacillus naozhouensis]